jgi:hypothetical protein
VFDSGKNELGEKVSEYNLKQVHKWLLATDQQLAYQSPSQIVHCILTHGCGDEEQYA